MEFFNIGGVTPFTTIDFPECLSAVFYFKGCVFNCPYCHNREFIERGEPGYPFESFKAFIDERKDFLDAIVFSGGEPLLFIDELEFLADYVKRCGLKVGIHTTGYSPEKLKKIIDKGLIDWAGIDLKADRKNYPFASGTKRNYFEKTAESIEILKNRGVDFEVRTTIFEGLADFEKLAMLIDEYRNLKIANPVFQIYSQNGVPERGIKKCVEDFLSTHSLRVSLRE